MFREFLFIAVGGAIGACLRAFSYTFFASVNFAGLPWGQVVANISGSFLAGIAIFFIDQLSLEMKNFLIVGFLGSFTTMSAYAVDIQQMLHDKLFMTAFLLWFSGAVICIAAAFFGFFVAGLTR